MKTIQKVLLTIIMAAVPFMLTGQSKDKTTSTVKYATSIDCDHCVNKIMTNLPHEKGIKDVKCDLKTKEVAVTYQKDKNNPEQIKKSIEKLGYTAKEITAESSQKKDK
jgi:copper chaperone CopZ